MSLLDPVANALGSIPQEQIQAAVELEKLERWARDAEQLAAQAVGPGEWERSKDLVAERIENANIGFEGLTVEQAAGTLVDAYKFVRSKAESKRQGAVAKAVVKAAHAGSYRDLIRGDQ